MKRLHWRPAALTALLLLGQRMAAAADIDYTVARQQFQQAMTEAARPASADANDGPALRAYPLYAYLEAERIRQSFSSDPVASVPVDQRAAGFLATYGLLPVGAQLRRSWLENLAQRAQWTTFLDVFRDAGATEALRCQALTARIDTGQTAQLGPTLVRLWLTTHQVPECDLPYAWGLDHGVITADLVERRVRLALATGNTGLANPLISRLPAPQGAPLRQWADLLDAPLRNIDTLVNEPATTVLPEALLGGWSRLARLDPDAAIERYAPLVRARGLTFRQRQPARARRGVATRLAARRACRRLLRPSRHSRPGRQCPGVAGSRGAVGRELAAGDANHCHDVADRPPKCSLAVLGGTGIGAGWRDGAGARSVRRAGPG